MKEQKTHVQEETEKIKGNACKRKNQSLNTKNVIYQAFLCLLFTQIRDAARTRGKLNAEFFPSHTEQNEVLIMTHFRMDMPELLTDNKLVLLF